MVGGKGDIRTLTRQRKDENQTLSQVESIFRKVYFLWDKIIAKSITIQLK